MAKRMAQQEALDRLKNLLKRQTNARINFAHERIDQKDLDAIKIAYKALQREVDEENSLNKLFDEIMEKVEEKMANENKTQGE